MIILLSLLAQSALAMWCYPSGTSVTGTGTATPSVCIGAHDLGTGATQFTLFAGVGGWAGFALSSQPGDNMGPGDAVVAYLDKTQKVAVASFVLAGPGAITPNTANPWSLVPLNTTIPQPSWAPIAASFTKSNAAVGTGGLPINVGATSNFIFVNSDGSLTLPMHGTNNHTGVTAEILSSSGGSGPSIIPLPASLSMSMIVLIHVILMSLAFVLIPPFAMFVAMFLREKLRDTWFAVHLGLMLGGTLLLGVLGAVVMVLFYPGPLFGTIHQILGVSTIVLLFFQLGLGIYARSASSPLPAQIHKYFGLVLTYLVVPIQVYLGFSGYTSLVGTPAPLWLMCVPIGFAVIGLGTLAAGYFLLPYGEADAYQRDPYGGGGKRGNYGGVGQGGRRDFVELERSREYGGSSTTRGGGGGGGVSRNGSRNASRNEAGGGYSGNGRSGRGAAGAGADYPGSGSGNGRSGNGRDYQGAPRGGAGASSGGHGGGGGGGDYNASRKAPARSEGGGASSSNGHYDPMAIRESPSRAHPGQQGSVNRSASRSRRQVGGQDNRAEHY
ncbi:hypothetical protein HDU98_012293 [Podochytrium sp. JEL0797]|nr:hypothetical protein HDU98_012293 [Podochytrium sp. JEL0797]